MAKKIALFNHKGGVSKTTTAFHLGWMLASKGNRVILVDADPQCNLSGLILGLKGESDFDTFYEKHPDRNIRAGLAPAFEAQPRAISPIECVPVEGQDGLFLLPGHLRLTEYEVVLGIAQELSGTLQALQNLPGSFSYLLNETAKHHKADFVLVDMNPSLSSINQNLLMTSDHFLVPTSPDYFSVMAIDSLAVVLPRWQAWATRARNSPILQAATYPFPSKDPKFLGTVIQKYRPRSGEATVGFQKWIDAINDKVGTQLHPSLLQLNMALAASRYKGLKGVTASGFCLAQIADFNTLISKSQEHQTPVFALTPEQLGHVGTVLAADEKKRDDFGKIFSTLADNVLALTSDASGT